MVGPQQDDRVIADRCDHAEVLLLVVVAERFQKFEDLYLVLEDSLGALLVGRHRLVQNQYQPLNSVYLDELAPGVPAWPKWYFSEM